LLEQGSCRKLGGDCCLRPPQLARLSHALSAWCRLHAGKVHTTFSACSALPVFVPSALAFFLESLHLRLFLPCEQLPTHSLQYCLFLPCEQMPLPTHSLHYCLFSP
jgi:hypothetical protein